MIQFAAILSCYSSGQALFYVVHGVAADSVVKYRIHQCSSLPTSTSHGVLGDELVPLRQQALDSSREAVDELRTFARTVLAEVLECSPARLQYTSYIQT